METARSIIDCAFCFDAVIFGGYVRDVIVCQSEAFKDIDILWLEGEKEFQKFMRVLHAQHKVTEYREVSCKYGRQMNLKHFRVDDVLVDVVLYEYTFDTWKANDLCDLSCNLFYMTRKIHLGIRSIPSFLKHSSNPVAVLMDMARRKKYKVLEKNCNSVQVLKILHRCLYMARRGWMHEDTFSELGVLTPYHRRIVSDICDVEEDHVAKLLTAHLPERILDKVINHLFDRCSDGGSEDDARSVNQENADDDSLDQS
jgi:hypothetical protein